MIFFLNKIIISVFVMLVYFSLFGCRIFFVEGTRSILLGVKSMSCIVQFEQESCDVFASRTKSLCIITATEYRCTASLYIRKKNLSWTIINLPYIIWKTGLGHCTRIAFLCNRSILKSTHSQIYSIQFN